MVDVVKLLGHQVCMFLILACNHYLAGRAMQCLHTETVFLITRT